MSWPDDAACRGAPADVFFPERGVSTDDAKAVCRRCTVANDCLEYALANNERFGIWGGKSARERQQIRRRRRRNAGKPGCGQSERTG